MKIKRLLKWLCPIFLLTAGIIITTEMPTAVESLLPVVSTIKPEKTEYRKTVTGSGCIYQLEEWYARISVNESNIRYVSPGQEVFFSGAAFDAGIYSGVVETIASSAKQVTTRGFPETVVDVIVKFTNSDENLKSGYTTDAEIIISEVRDMYIIPYEVICQDDVGEYVYVLEGNTAVRCDIITGTELSTGTEIISGIRETDEIITSPQSVMENMLVKK